MIISLIGLTLAAYSEGGKEINSEIKNVTVYLQGAEVSREGVVTVPKGTTTFIFKGLSSKISPESIQVSATNGPMVVSVTHSMDYLNKATAGKDIKLLETRRKEIIDSIKLLNNFKTVYVQEKDMILSNKSIAGDNGVNVNELEQAATFFRKRLTEIESATHKMDNSVFGLKTNLVMISKQLQELNSKIDLPTSQVTVVISAEADTRSNIRLTYFIADASWIPAYDVRIKEVNEPLGLFYKAKVLQNSNEEWNNVNLTLSTGNPSISNNKPELSAYYLTFNNYYTDRSNLQLTSRQPVRGKVTGKVTDSETKEALPGVNVIVKGTTTGTVTDTYGNYQIDLPAGSDILSYTFLGYQAQEQIANSPVLNIVMTPDIQMLEEVVVAAYGVSGDEVAALQGRVAGVTVSRKKEQIPLGIEKRQLTTEFQIKIPYSIPSDNQPYDVSMVEYEIDAEYQYSAIPKLSKDAYLIARIPDYFKYSLLNGNANIFFKGVYQGESFIDLDTPLDTLTLSVGRDQDIIISREIQKDFVSKSLMGSSRKEQKSWLITIKNNKAVPVSITVEDQYPVSKTDDIKVDLIESSGAKQEESTGRLTWDLKLKPGEKKEIYLRYSVKYPSGRPLIIE